MKYNNLQVDNPNPSGFSDTLFINSNDIDGVITLKVDNSLILNISGNQLVCTPFGFIKKEYLPFLSCLESAKEKADLLALRASEQAKIDAINLRLSKLDFNDSSTVGLCNPVATSPSPSSSTIRPSPSFVKKESVSSPPPQPSRGNNITTTNISSISSNTLRPLSATGNVKDGTCGRCNVPCERKFTFCYSCNQLEEVKSLPTCVRCRSKFVPHPNAPKALHCTKCFIWSKNNQRKCENCSNMFSPLSDNARNCVPCYKESFSK